MIKYLLILGLVNLTSGAQAKADDLKTTRAHLNCIDKMLHTDFRQFKDVKKCIKTQSYSCMMAYLDKWELKCIKEELTNESNS